MTMIAAMGRMEQIQASLHQLSAGATVPKAAATPAVAATNADAFAAQLAAAMGTGPTTATAIATAIATATGTSAVGSTGGKSGVDVVGAAKKYLGVPYVFGGEDSSGMDCSGLVQKVYADIGIDMPRLVSGQMKMGTEVASLAEAQPGDLIVTGGGAHILIYAGDHKVIHAPYPGRTVCLREAYMSDAEITTIRRIIPTATAVTGTAGSGTAGIGTADMLSAAFASFAKGGAA
ncbi:MAG: C40 family peptidase [Cryobacterium sp.]|uniref:C40 family peptidase n=1 Tax=Cryobacterium sp. TaxID=1926290 RepID=UPI0022A1CAE8|nr:C40 family peptidase [Cryobacterium sp.]MCY7404481.1 C40 family peptidase [Cryobacterium sp.]